PSALILPNIWLGVGDRAGSSRPVSGLIPPTTRFTATQSLWPCWLKVSVVSRPTLKLFHDRSARESVWLTVTSTAPVAAVTDCVGRSAPCQTLRPLPAISARLVTLTVTAASRPPFTRPFGTDCAAARAASR